MLSFPELYALNRSTGLTRGNPLKGTSSHSLASAPERGLPTSGGPSRILGSPPQPQHSSVRRTRVKTEHGLHCKTVTTLNRSTGSHKGQHPPDRVVPGLSSRARGKATHRRSYYSTVEHLADCTSGPSRCPYNRETRTSTIISKFQTELPSSKLLIVKSMVPKSKVQSPKLGSGLGHCWV